jgi:hypothetical protein
MGGAKLVGELASDRPDMKILSAPAMPKPVQRHGAIDVTKRSLQKPFSLKALARMIREVLRTEAPALAASAASVWGSPVVPPIPPLSYNWLPES